MLLLTSIIVRWTEKHISVYNNIIPCQACSHCVIKKKKISGMKLQNLHQLTAPQSKQQMSGTLTKMNLTRLFMVPG